MYKILESGLIFNKIKYSFITPYPNNRYYIKFLEWCDEGNIPEYEIETQIFIDKLKNKKIYNLEILFKQKLSEDIEYNNEIYEFNPDIYAQILNRALYASISIENSTIFAWDKDTWENKNKEDIVFKEPNDFLLFFKFIIDHYDNIKNIYKNHKNNILNLTTKNEIDSYDIKTGWAS